MHVLYTPLRLDNVGLWLCYLSAPMGGIFGSLGVYTTSPVHRLPRRALYYTQHATFVTRPNHGTTVTPVPQYHGSVCVRLYTSIVTLQRRSYPGGGIEKGVAELESR